MGKKSIYHYYVEGEDERSIINALKSELGCIESGKVEIFNVNQQMFSNARIRPLRPGTTVVLVYDTDVETNLSILELNIKFLNKHKKQNGIKDVICIPQVKNLEDELLRACQITRINELTKSVSKTNFKSDLNSCTNLGDRLRKCQFDIAKFWNQIPTNKFQSYGNDSAKIKRRSE